MRIPLAVTIGTRDSTLTKDALLLNCYAEADQEGSLIYSRPGTDASTAYTGNGQGTYMWRGELYSIFGDVMTNESTGTSYQLSTNYPGQQYQFAETPGQAGTSTSGGGAWTQVTAAAAFSARNGAAGCVLNGKMWFAGGINSLGVHQNDVYSSTDGVTWTQVTAAANWSARYGHQMVAFDGKLWVMGGTANGGASTLQDVWNSSDGATWTQVDATADWAVRYYFGCVVFNNKLYVMGGAAGSGGSTQYNDVWSSPDGDAWTQVDAAADWTARNLLGCVVFQGKIFVYGGVNSATSTLFNDVYSSPDGATWTQVTATADWAARYGFGAVVYGGKMWVFGGIKAASAYDDDVWYSSAGATWTQATAAAGWAARASAVSLAFSNQMWIMSGSDGTPTYYNDVYNSDLDSTTAQVGATPYLMVKNNNEAWYLTGATPTLTQISDADYPLETVPGCVNLDGTFYVMNRAGVVFGSDVEDPSAWNSLNFITSEAEPDIGVYCGKILNYVVALADWSIEVFEDAANATGSPLDRIGGAFRQYGCASAGSVAYIENGMVMVSQSRLRGREVIRMLGLEVEKISTPQVEKIILADSLGTVHSYCFKAGGHEFYVLTLVASAVTLVCDLTNKMWYQWTSQIAGTAQNLTSVTSSGTTATATLAAHGYSDGQVVLIAGANQSGYNGTFVISRTDANTFTYTVASGLVTPATGTITATGYTDGYFRYINYVNNNGTDTVQHVSDGKLYLIGASYTNDDDIRINCRARTGVFDGQTLNNKIFDALRLVADTVSGANVYIRRTKDDYTSYNKFRKLSIANERKELRNWGSARRIAFEVLHADDSAFIASDLEPTVRAWRI